MNDDVWLQLIVGGLLGGNVFMTIFVISLTIRVNDLKQRVDSLTFILGGKN